MNEAQNTTDRPPQGITVRFMCTGNDKRDYVGIRKLPRVDPASLGEGPYLALPIRATPHAEPTGVRIRQFTPENAAEILTWEQDPMKRQGVHLATDAEVEALRAEEAARAEKLKADRIRRDRLELERHLAGARYSEEVQEGVRASYAEKPTP